MPYPLGDQQPQIPSWSIRWLWGQCDGMSPDLFRLYLLPSLRHLWRRAQLKPSAWRARVGIAAQNADAAISFAENVQNPAACITWRDPNLGPLELSNSALNRSEFVTGVLMLMQREWLRPLKQLGVQSIEFLTTGDALLVRHAPGMGQPRGVACLELPVTADGAAADTTSQDLLGLLKNTRIMHQGSRYWTVTLAGQMAEDDEHHGTVKESMHRLFLWQAHGPRQDWDGWPAVEGQPPTYIYLPDGQIGCPYLGYDASHACHNAACLEWRHLGWDTHKNNRGKRTAEQMVA